ncbi:HAUS augmin-like complex subunit 5 [Boleophthalmus pectinirostris]|uniref:HAUS augmin-like complex subunit 5 n=1 Tax=Boleophthalmus pectinirostris TaxID=150288 RepID=UPI00242D9E96|nr:HAUS augmin-like complex subunit 5 [Boleophthalmus pectinirostris]XP_055020960.1 HAUS augmin-like complex subunit 5 [Boleophthalmus pectinirostris]XP_055020961.1 HAUS augmin-like complex subunit 5 [Boleophthalmus pectinirostris]
MMADRNLVQELKRWATEEFNLPPDSLPNDSYFKTLCVGTGKSIWKYVIQHVYHQRKIKMIRGNLKWYNMLQENQMKQAEGKSEAAKQKDLQREIEKLAAEIAHLDSQISGTEEQLATQEQSIGRTWAQVEDNRCRELLLLSLRQHCVEDRQVLIDDIKKINGHSQALEQMTRKAEVEVLFDKKSLSDKESLNSKAAPEAQVLREVRELCNDRIQFYQSLQESELKMEDTLMTREQRKSVFQYWLSAAEDLLCGYPPNQILSALQYLAVSEQKDLEDKVGSLNVTHDATALKFRFEDDHLMDISAEAAEELPPVKTLLQAAWEEVEQSLVELAQTRVRVTALRNQLLSHKKETEQEMSGFAEDLHNDSLAMSTLEVELQCVMQAATRDFIRDRCIQMDQQARSRQEVLRNLQSQWQSILNFRKLVDLRQEDIRSLIKANSTAKTDLIRQQKELQDFVQGKLVPKFDDVTSAVFNVRNSISKEAKQLGTLSLLALDRRTVEGTQRIPASWLSIHRLQSPLFRTLCQNMFFPLYRAPDELCSHARSQWLELWHLQQLLQLQSATLKNTQKETELLHASDQKALLSKVHEEDQKLLKALVPRVRSLTQCCAQGLSYGDQVKIAISYW